MTNDSSTEKGEREGSDRIQNQRLLNRDQEMAGGTAEECSRSSALSNKINLEAFALPLRIA